jgi:chaperone required for assembly of F1-ATPase
MSDKTLRDDFLQDLLRQAAEPIDPVAMAQRDLKKALPKRFYTIAQAREEEGAFVLTLDGRVAKTPAKSPLALPTEAAAHAVAAEWEAQEDYIDPAFMPLTRIVNSAIDGVASQIEATIGEIAKYAGSDLVCYRASNPQELVAAQAATWDPILAFAKDKLGARFICAEGVMFVAQPDQACQILRTVVEDVTKQAKATPFALAALHVMTTLTGSALIALAVAYDEMTPEAAWAAAHVDEDFQMKLWGSDEEALRRRAARWTEMEAAARLFRLVRNGEKAK